MRYYTQIKGTPPNPPPYRRTRSLRTFSAAFTIVELLVVIIIIGILATVTIVAYNGIQQQARDKSLLTDIDNLDNIETQYAYETNTQGKAWDSTTGIDASLNFKPGSGNIVIVTMPNPVGYCMKAYNPTSNTYKTLATAYSKETQPGACTTPPAPVIQPYNYTGALQTFTVPTGVTKVTLEVTGGGGGSETCFDCGTGGSGGYAKGVLAVIGGDILNITVGGGGSDSSSNASSGGNTQINRPASSALLIGSGGGGGYGYGYNGVPGQGYTYAPVTNATTTTGTAYWPAIAGKAKVTYTPGV